MCLLSLVTTLLIFGWIDLVFFWNLKSNSRKELKPDKLSFGKPVCYLLFYLFFLGYHVLSVILNWGFSLGKPPAELVELGALLLGFVSIFYGSIFGLAQLFGEVYGWRFFLQTSLSKQHGRSKGVLLVGLILGLWHAPLIVGAGWAFPGYLVLGVILFTISTIMLSIPLGFAVFKSRSVWLPAFALGGSNYSANSLASNFYIPTDAVYSFGIGIYGSLSLGVIAFIFLKAEIGKGEKSNILCAAVRKAAYLPYADYLLIPKNLVSFNLRNKNVISIDHKFETSPIYPGILEAISIIKNLPDQYQKVNRRQFLLPCSSYL